MKNHLNKLFFVSIVFFEAFVDSLQNIVQRYIVWFFQLLFNSFTPEWSFFISIVLSLSLTHTYTDSFAYLIRWESKQILYIKKGGKERGRKISVTHYFYSLSLSPSLYLPLLWSKTNTFMHMTQYVVIKRWWWL